MSARIITVVKLPCDFLYIVCSEKLLKQMQFTAWTRVSLFVPRVYTVN